LQTSICDLVRQPLQERACDALVNLAYAASARAKAIELGGFDLLLAAVNNHLDSAIVCENACWAMGDVQHREEKY
jgi:hypothetical protein